MKLTPCVHNLVRDQRIAFVVILRFGDDIAPLYASVFVEGEYHDVFGMIPRRLISGTKPIPRRAISIRTVKWRVIVVWRAETATPWIVPSHIIPTVKGTTPGTCVHRFTDQQKTSVFAGYYIFDKVIVKSKPDISVRAF